MNGSSVREPRAGSALVLERRRWIISSLLAAATRGPAVVALEACAVADHGELLACTARVSFVALDSRDSDLLGDFVAGDGGYLFFYWVSALRSKTYALVRRIRTAGSDSRVVFGHDLFFLKLGRLLRLSDGIRSKVFRGYLDEVGSTEVGDG